jgi:hypothetical protein
LESKLIIYV